MNPFPYSNKTTFNLENVVRQNILKSDYYNRTCLELTSWEEVVDEIYDNVVDSVEPWMSGNARGPSTAFCLLHRLMTLDLTVKQVRDLIDHRDSPYIRAIGFLFLRYVSEPKSLWQWCGRYANDKEEFNPSPDGKKVTMGDFVRDLLLEQYYFETIFPRIPKPVLDSIIEELKERKLPAAGRGNGGAGGADRRGTDDGNKRPASVKASLSVAMGQRAPNRAGTVRSMADKEPSRTARSPPAAKRRTEFPAGAGRAERDTRDRDDSRDRRRDPRESDRHDDRYRESRDDRYRDRASRYDAERVDRSSRRDEDRYGGSGRDRGDSRRDDRERRLEDDRSRREDKRDDRRRSRSRSRDRRRRDDSRDRRRSRSSSRDRNGGGRDARDVFRESARTAGTVDVDTVKSKYL